MMTRRHFVSLVVSILVIVALFIKLTIIVSGNGAISLWLHGVDEHVQTFAYAHSSLVLARLMLFITYLANAEVVIALGIVLLIIFIIVHEELLAGIFFACLIVGETLGLSIKLIIERTRPAEVLYHVSRVGFSYPSGHTLTATLFYGFLAFCLGRIFCRPIQKKLIWTGGCILIFLVGISRIYLGVHWASDVIGGWLLGGAIVILFILLFTLLEKRFKKAFRAPRKNAVIIIIVALLILVGFVCYFYVTHLADFRSIITSTV